MKKLILILAIVVSTCWSFAQQVEPARYEIPRTTKDQGCRFESFGSQGGILVYETDKTDKDKNRLWSFSCVDTCLFEVRNDLIPLPDKMDITATASDDGFAVFLFTNEKSKKSDTLDFLTVTFDRNERTYQSFSAKLPDKSVILSVKVVDGVMMLAVNSKSGNGNLYFYDLKTHSYRIATPSSSRSFVLFHAEAMPKQHCFVIAAKEFENRFFVSTAFLVYSSSGALLKTYRYDNIPNGSLGRIAFQMDDYQHLTVIGTLERERNKRIDVEGIIEDFNRISVGVVWIGFASGQAQTKHYLFKDMPNIEMALTSSDRVRVREAKLKKNKKQSQGEIAFQFLTPRLTSVDSLTLFAVEAFEPVYHTETRMDYGYGFGYRGMYPYSYTVFDGYDFFSDVILAFDNEGNLKWQTSAKFSNALTYDLTPHACETICYDELVVASSSYNNLRYVSFDLNGNPVLTPQSEMMDTKLGADELRDEYFAELKHWYGNRFVIFGSQIIRNSIQANPQRSVFFLQKVQFE